MERVLKILDALSFAYVGALGLLLYLHATLTPSVPQVEQLLSWASWGWIPIVLVREALQPKGADGWQFRLPPVILAALVVVFLVIFHLPWGFDTPLMMVPFGLSIVLIGGWQAIRGLDRSRQ